MYITTSGNCGSGSGQPASFVSVHFAYLADREVASDWATRSSSVSLTFFASGRSCMPASGTLWSPTLSVVVA